MTHTTGTVRGKSDRIRSKILGLGVLLALFPSISFSHEFWLSPDRFGSAGTDSISIRAYVGTGFRGDNLPFATPRAVRLSVDDPAPHDLLPAAINGEIAFAVIAPPRSRGEMLCYESHFTPIELPAAVFEPYLVTEGLDAPLAAWRKAPRATSRERYRRCAKLWLGPDDPTITRPHGLTLEIVPLDDPVTAVAPRVQVLFEGKPLEGALVRAWNQPLGKSGGMPRDPALRDSVGPVNGDRTDAGGIAHLAIPGSGEWMIGVVHMLPSTDPAIADWESTWSTLVFARMKE